MLTAFKYLWAAPASLLGIAVGLVCRGNMNTINGTLEFYNIPLPHWPALCLGHVILYKSLPAAAIWRQHELVHVKQYELFGPTLIPIYLLFALVLKLLQLKPYYDNPFEIQAYKLVPYPSKLD